MKGGKERLAGGGDWRDMVRLFEALRKKSKGHFELVSVRVACGSASSAAGGCSASVKRNTRSLVQGSSRLLAHELHCCGDCTGMHLTSAADEAAFGDLLKRGRKFKLRSDPLAREPSG